MEVMRGADDERMDARVARRRLVGAERPDAAEAAAVRLGPAGLAAREREGDARPHASRGPGMEGGEAATADDAEPDGADGRMPEPRAGRLRGDGAGGEWAPRPECRPVAGGPRPAEHLGRPPDQGARGRRGRSARARTERLRDGIEGGAAAHYLIPCYWSLPALRNVSYNWSHAQGRRRRRRRDEVRQARADVRGALRGGRRRRSPRRRPPTAPGGGDLLRERGGRGRGASAPHGTAG